MPTTALRQIHFVPEGTDLSSNASDSFLEAVERAIASRGVSTVALGGGAVMRKLFELLASEPYASRLEPLWTRLHVFWTAERHVRPDHPDSFYRLAHWTLLSRFAVPSSNVHRIRGEMADRSAVAAAYQHELRTFFQPRGLMRDGLPCFDLTVLTPEEYEVRGIATEPEENRGRWVTSQGEDAHARGEIALSLPVLENARRTLLLFRGGDAVAARRAAQLLRFVA